MPGLNTPVPLNALRTVVLRNWQEEMAKTTTWADDYFMRVPSTTSLNTYAWLGQMPLFREWVGPRIVKGLAERIYQVQNKRYEATVGIPFEQLSDADSVLSAPLIATGLGEQAKKLTDDLILDLLKNGETRVGYDGQYFFDTDHPISAESTTGTQQNYWASGMGLTTTNFQTVLTAATSIKGENGRVINSGGQWRLVIPRALELTAKNIVGISTLAGGAQNPQYGAAQAVVVDDLNDDPTTWYLFNMSGSIKPFILQTREDVQIEVKADQTRDENMFWHREVIIGGQGRLGAGYGLWFKAFKAKA